MAQRWPTPLPNLPAPAQFRSLAPHPVRCVRHVSSPQGSPVSSAQLLGATAPPTRAEELSMSKLQELQPAIASGLAEVGGGGMDEEGGMG